VCCTPGQTNVAHSIAGEIIGTVLLNPPVSATRQTTYEAWRDPQSGMHRNLYSTVVDDEMMGKQTNTKCLIPTLQTREQMPLSGGRSLSFCCRRLTQIIFPFYSNVSSGCCEESLKLMEMGEEMRTWQREGSGSYWCGE
jgi:hypothetical protein